MRNKLVLAVPLALLVLTLEATADAIPVEPGLWEMTSTISMPMMPQPRVNSVTECIEKNELSMEDVATDGMDPNCVFETGQVDGATMNWSFECPVEGGTSRGDWTATSHGDRVEGGGKLTMEMQGQTMEMTMSWTGKRIGACP